jgi:hypothetical protein
MKHRPEMVLMPNQHQGVQQALLGSFGALPSMPPEFIRLLDRLL